MKNSTFSRDYGNTQAVISEFCFTVTGLFIIARIDERIAIILWAESMKKYTQYYRQKVIQV